MNEFEIMWRNRVNKNIRKLENVSVSEKYCTLSELDAIPFTNQLIDILTDEVGLDETRQLFQNCACHMPKENLETIKDIYQQTQSIEVAHKALLDRFRVDIKEYKKIDDEKVNQLINAGMGVAGIYQEDKIVVTKIPSLFHEYYSESDLIMKKYYYCHCPRVRKLLLDGTALDSIYCNCGGGFYKDIWEYITGDKVNIKVLKNLFDGDDVCSFMISFGNIYEEDSK